MFMKKFIKFVCRTKIIYSSDQVVAYKTLILQMCNNKVREYTIMSTYSDCYYKNCEYCGENRTCYEVYINMNSLVAKRIGCTNIIDFDNYEI